jgi:hypothetical protein
MEGFVDYASKKGRERVARLECLVDCCGVHVVETKLTSTNVEACAMLRASSGTSLPTFFVMKTFTAGTGRDADNIGCTNILN